MPSNRETSWSLPADRADVFVAVAMAAVNKTAFAGLVLTGDTELPPGILELCRPALETGLPVLKVSTNSWQTATRSQPDEHRGSRR